MSTSDEEERLARRRVVDARRQARRRQRGKTVSVQLMKEDAIAHLKAITPVHGGEAKALEHLLLEARAALRSQPDSTASIHVVTAPALKRDYVGRRIRTTKALRNGYVEIPIGSLGVIDAQRPRGSTITFEACTACRMRAIISRVSSTDFEFVEATSVQPAP